jgi:hypothetical protein
MCRICQKPIALRNLKVDDRYFVTLSSEKARVLKQVLGLFAATALVGGMPVFAASETLDYTSAALTSTWNDGSFLGSVSDGSKFSAVLTLSAPLGDSLSNVNESSKVTSLVFTVGGDTLTLSPSAASGSAFYFTTSSSGVITGWNFTAGQTGVTPYILFHSCSMDNCASGSYGGNVYGATGDWYDFQPGTNVYAGGCSYGLASSCSSGSGSVGTWVVAAPELDAGSGVAGLTLLIGGVMVLRGGRRKLGPAAG